MRELFLDFETRSLINIKEAGAPNYCSDPSTAPLMLSWAIDDREVQLWEPDLGPLPEPLDIALHDPETRLIAWNVNFERSIFEHCLKFSTPIERWFDVKILARYLSLPGKLAEACAALNLPSDIGKMVDAGDVGIKTFSMPMRKGGQETLFGVEPPFFNSRANKPKEWEQFGLYCKQDTFVERYIYRMLAKKFPLPENEMKLWYLDQEINRRGMPLAVHFVENGLKMAEASIAELRKTLIGLTGLENPNSDSQMLAWVQTQGYPFTSMGKALVAQALANPRDLTPLAQEVLHIRKEFRRSSYKKLDAILPRVSPDGRLRDCFAFMGGSRTGRWAGQDVQFQNLARPDKKVEKNLDKALALIDAGDFETAKTEFGPTIEFCGQKKQVPSVIGMVTSCIRSVFQAKDGNILVVCDLSAIENRVLGWLAGCKAILDVFEKGLDPYISFACLMFFIEYAEVTKDQRQVAKPPVLGCGYGLGPGVIKNPDGTYTIIWKCDECMKNVELGHSCFDDKGNRKGDLIKTGLLGYAENMGVHLTPEQAFLAHEAFRRAYPEVSQLWWDLEKAAVETIRTGKKTQVRFIEFSRAKRKDGTFVLRCLLPSGRSLHYINARVTTEVKKSRAGNDYEKHSIYYDGIGHGVGATTHKMGWAPVYTYGGKLTENIVQAISRDILAHGMMLAEEVGLPIVGHVHDEILCEVRDEEDRAGLNDLKWAMSETPSWAPGLPLAAEGYEGKMYRKG